MMTVWAVLGGFVLDAIFGDPAWLPHPSCVLFFIYKTKTL